MWIHTHMLVLPCIAIFQCEFLLNAFFIVSIYQFAQFYVYIFTYAIFTCAFCKVDIIIFSLFSCAHLSPNHDKCQQKILYRQ